MKFIFLTSFLQRIGIQFARVLDHSYRILTGLPMLRRSQITPHLYLGGQYYFRALNQLRKYGITAVVNMRMAPVPPWISEQGFRMLHLPTVEHHAPSLKQLEEGATFIKNEIEKYNGIVYVHCHWGEGRGPSMAIAYLISTGLTYEDADKLVRSVRPFIHPNREQTDQLKKFEARWKKLHPTPLERITSSK